MNSAPTIRELTRRTRGHRLIDIVQELKTALTGWKAYFGITEVMSPLREIDKWVRRRLRCYAWKQWGSAGCHYSLPTLSLSLTAVMEPPMSGI